MPAELLLIVTETAKTRDAV